MKPGRRPRILPHDIDPNLAAVADKERLDALVRDAQAELRLRGL